MYIVHSTYTCTRYVVRLWQVWGTRYLVWGTMYLYKVLVPRISSYIYVCGNRGRGIRHVSESLRAVRPNSEIEEDWTLSLRTHVRTLRTSGPDCPLFQMKINRRVSKQTQDWHNLLFLFSSLLFSLLVSSPSLFFLSWKKFFWIPPFCCRSVCVCVLQKFKY